MEGAAAGGAAAIIGLELTAVPSDIVASGSAGAAAAESDTEGNDSFCV